MYEMIPHAHSHYTVSSVKNQQEDETMSKKSANGTGTMRQRAPGQWEYRVVVGCGIDGKAIRKSFYAKTKTAAREKYKEYLKNADKPRIEKISTIGEWAKSWLST